MSRAEKRDEALARPDNIRCGIVRHLQALGRRGELPEFPQQAEVADFMARQGWTEDQALYWLRTTLCDGSPAQLGLWGATA